MGSFELDLTSCKYLFLSFLLMQFPLYLDYYCSIIRMVGVFSPPALLSGGVQIQSSIRNVIPGYVNFYSAFENKSRLLAKQNKYLWDSNPRFQIYTLSLLTFCKNIFRTSGVSSTNFGSILIFSSYHYRQCASYMFSCMFSGF